MYNKTVQKSKFLGGRKDQGSSSKCTENNKSTLRRLLHKINVTKMHKSRQSQQYKFLSKSKYIYLIIKRWLFAYIFALICYFCHFCYFRYFCCIREAFLLHLPPKNYYFCADL